MLVLSVLFLLVSAVQLVAFQNIRSGNRFASSPTCLFNENFLLNEVVREGGNLANFAVGALGLMGRGAWEVGKLAVPVLEKAVDTVAPIVSEKAGEAINYAVPIVEAKSRAASDYATTTGAATLQQQADGASKNAAALMKQLQDGQAGKSLAGSLREAAARLDPEGAASKVQSRGMGMGMGMGGGGGGGGGGGFNLNLGALKLPPNPLEARINGLQDELKWVGIKAGGSFVGVVGVLAVLKKIAEPVEKVARTVFFYAFIAGTAYVGAVYGPKVYQIYEVFNH